MENSPTREALKQEFEDFTKNNPKTIFNGAILASGNKLVTDYERVIDLFTEMQNGNFTYPESMQPIIEHVRICPGYIYPGSEQIDWVFRGVSFLPSIIWHPRDFTGRWGWYAGQYELSEEATENFLKKWGHDEAAMDFFARCAEFLTIKQRRSR